jgi:uncharacterized protein (UPF0332 family)
MKLSKVSHCGKGPYMDQEFKQYIKNKTIVPFPGGKQLVKREIDIAKSDLSDAITGYNNQIYKWSTIQAYHSLRHAAKALVYSRGYRVKDHYAMVVAIKVLFVDENLIGINIIRDFLNAINLREVAEYEAEFSMPGAKAVISAAERMINNAAIILNID